MPYLYAILILYPVINFAEAWLEVVVIDLKNPYIHQYSKLNRREHFRSGVYACLVGAVVGCVALHLHLYALLPAIFLNRRLVFDYSLKLLRNRPFDTYEGDGIFDSIGRRLFGRDGADKELLLLLLVTITSIYYTL